MSAPQTRPMDHLIIPNGDEDSYRWSGMTANGPQELSPIQLLTGEWGLPVTASLIPELPKDLKSSLSLLYGRELTCCDFIVCHHDF